MREIRAYKAQQISADTESLAIVFDDIFPGETGENWKDVYEKMHQEQAEKIADALFAVMPGGSLSRLTAEMMKRQAGLLVVPCGWVVK